MGKRGPTPTRTDEKVRRHKPENEGRVPLSKGVARGFDAWPTPGANWDAPTIRFYNSFKHSGIADYYEATDVELVWLTIDELNEHRNGKGSAFRFDSLFKALSAMGATEDGRRRMLIELEAPKSDRDELPEFEIVHSLRENTSITGG